MRGLVREISGDVTERNYAREPLSRTEIKSIVDRAGSMAELVNTRHAIAKNNGWKTKPPSKTALIRAGVEDTNVLRRPILVRGDKCVVGRDPDAVRNLLEN